MGSYFTPRCSLEVQEGNPGYTSNNTTITNGPRLKSLTYVSRQSWQLSSEDLARIQNGAIEFNKSITVTGVLIYTGGYFFQTIEGSDADIDRVFATRIAPDRRHHDIFVLKVHYIAQRRYPDWSMRTVNLDENNDIIILAIRIMLQTVADAYEILEKYTQPQIMKMLFNGENPLQAPPLLQDKIILFTDIFSFSTLCEKLAPSDVVNLVNHYFTICTTVITSKGGEVNKFIGDCVMAYFPTTLARNAIEGTSIFIYIYIYISMCKQLPKYLCMVRQMQ
eukprot:GEZU01016608.1.p1 GENE.GEZU01016608.1~~GEZU01016608.1.p1  ORF type:complete len:321 (-),score=56.97 GEZU01016608.1:323-1156(-)